MGSRTRGTSGSSPRTGTAPSDDVRRGEAEAFARLVAAVEGATDEELFAEDPHPWLDGTLAETVIEDSVRSTSRTTSRTTDLSERP